MSRKRSWSLGSKWKLGKENEDYKQHKKNKRQGGLGYMTEKVTRPGKNKKFPCKKLKGDHDFKIVKLKKYSFFDKCAEVSECTACKKIKYKFIKK